VKTLGRGVQELQKKKKWLQEMMKQETEKKQAGRSLLVINAGKIVRENIVSVITDGQDGG